jgi:hypothetical protein
MITTHLDPSYLWDHGIISWPEIHYGLLHKYVSPSLAKRFLDEKIKRENLQDLNDDELELTIADSDDEIIQKVEVLAKGCDYERKVIEIKWLKVFLGWIYENNKKYDDPLGMVEQLYSEFDYPKEIEHLIRYMPADGPARHFNSQQEIRDHFLALVGQYVARP